MGIVKKPRIGTVASLFKREVKRLAYTHTKSSYIVRETLRFLEREQIVVPAYSTLQNVIGEAVQSEINRASEKLDRVLNDTQKKLLDDLVTNQGNFIHELTLLKRDPKDFSLKEIKKEIKKREKLDVFYEYISANYFLSELKISNKNLLEYAKLVNHYKIDQVSRMRPLTKRLLIICFVHVRYRVINDYLVNAFIQRVGVF